MIWRLADVKDGNTHKVHLCQAADGHRFFRLVVVGSSQDQHPANDVVFVSERVPLGLVKRRDVTAISESVPLEGGSPFYVDAHGIWFAASEFSALRAGVEFSEVAWVTGKPPKLEPM